MKSSFKSIRTLIDFKLFSTRSGVITCFALSLLKSTLSNQTLNGIVAITSGTSSQVASPSVTLSYSFSTNSINSSKKLLSNNIITLSCSCTSWTHLTTYSQGLNTRANESRGTLPMIGYSRLRRNWMTTLRGRESWILKR